MKLTGAALVILSGLFLGLGQAAKLRQRVEILLDWKRMIQSFRTGISYSACPLGELIAVNRDSRFCRLAAAEPGFLTEPKAALERAGGKLLRDAKDLELYRGFVRGLGDSDVQGQIEHMGLYGALVDGSLAQAKETREKKARLCVCLCLFGSVTLCLVLL